MEGQKHWYSSEINLKSQVIADVGANVGSLSQFFWDAGQGTNTVISIEPLPQNLKSIKKKIARSKAKNWRTAPFAVSGEDGELTLRRFHSRKHGWNSMVINPADTEVLPENVKDILISCKPLTELAPNATVVKIDIEGHEYAVFDQALAKLPQVHTWAMELHMREDRPLGTVIEQFMDNHYSLVAASQGPGGRWSSVNITPQLQWSSIPATNRLGDGREFKMLHVIAKRQL